MTSHPTTAVPAIRPNAGRLCPTADELTELERELDLYLAFWAHARDGRLQRPWNGERK